MKTPIIGTGLTGLVGSKCVEVLSDQFDFTNLDIASGIDITDGEAVLRAVEQSSAEVVVHFAAYTNVSEAHNQRDDKSGIAYQVNVDGTRNIAQACKQFDKYLIHLSTAYVFDGEKEGLYVETDPINPIEWYGQTKAWAEEEVDKSGVKYSILRIDQPYRDDEFPKLDIVHRIKQGLEQGTLPAMFTDHTFTPTHIEEFSKLLSWCIDHQPQGIFHATTDPVTTDYEFALSIKEKFQLSGEVKSSSVIDYLKTAVRPYHKNTALSVEKLKQVLDVRY